MKAMEFVNNVRSLADDLEAAATGPGDALARQRAIFKVISKHDMETELADLEA